MNICDRIFIHYGHNKFSDYLWEEVQNVKFCKPYGGLWASDINAKFGWKDWNKEEQYMKCDENNSFKFKLFGACYLFSRLLYKFSNFSNEVDLEKRRPLHESMLIKFALYTHIEIIINQQFAGKILDKISSLFDYDKCEYVATLGGPQKLKETQPKFWFGDGKPMQFENIIVNAMSHPENFLTKFYGKNFMTPPPINKRSQHNVELIEENNI